MSEDDRDEVERMKERRQLPFDKGRLEEQREKRADDSEGASEWVPTDMQPANEWSLLKDTFLFDWPLLPQQDFALRWRREGEDSVRELTGMVEGFLESSGSSSSPSAFPSQASHTTSPKVREEQRCSASLIVLLQSSYPGCLHPASERAA